MLNYFFCVFIRKKKGTAKKKKKSKRTLVETKEKARSFSYGTNECAGA